MRYIKDIENDFCKASLYNFNNKFIIKFEAGLMEQVYKISETEISGIDDIDGLLSPDFLEKVKQIFETMFLSFTNSLDEI